MESVKEEGILTALLVRPLGDGEYEIIAGHKGSMRHNLLVLKRFRLLLEIWIKIQLSVRW